MRKKVLWITETAVMLALLVTLQALTKPMGQLVTGSCVNAVLAISVLLVGMSSGITIALISPVCRSVWYCSELRDSFAHYDRQCVFCGAVAVDRRQDPPAHLAATGGIGRCSRC